MSATTNSSYLSHNSVVAIKMHHLHFSLNSVESCAKFEIKPSHVYTSQPPGGVHVVVGSG